MLLSACCMCCQFFASMMSTFTLNVVQSYVHERPWKLSFSGLLNFGEFTVTLATYYHDLSRYDVSLSHITCQHASVQYCCICMHTLLTCACIQLYMFTFTESSVQRCRGAIIRLHGNRRYVLTRIITEASRHNDFKCLAV